MASIILKWQQFDNLNRARLIKVLVLSATVLISSILLDPTGRGEDDIPRVARNK